VTDQETSTAEGSDWKIEPAKGGDVRWWQWVLALGLVVVVCGVGYWLIRATVRTYGALSDSAAAAIATASATVLVALVTLMGSRYLEGRANRRQEQQAKRIPVYEKFVAGILDIIGATRAPGDRAEPTPENVYPVFGRFTESLVIWGSDDVIREWVDYRAAIFTAPGDATPEEQVKSLLLLEDLFLAIRRDLGLRNKSIRRGDILRLWINDLK
jgi:hypothetical protein